MKRIKELAASIGNYRHIADIGCDHGYLLIEAFQNKTLESAVAADNKPGPLSQAKANIASYPFANKIDFALADGLAGIKEETEVVIIAGIGGMLMKKILSGDLKNVKRLVLQPNRDHYLVRKTVTELGFGICDEKIVTENNYRYQIIICEKCSEPVVYSEDELYFGPVLLRKKEASFREKLADDLRKLEKIEINPANEAVLKEKKERIKRFLC